MLKMGFSQAWVDMVMRCVRSVRLSVKLNGGLSAGFHPSWGLRQGEPLSPYLFIFCVEGFATLLKKAQYENVLKGAKFSLDGPHITHLRFRMTMLCFLRLRLRA
jgi:hypothetical protein